MKSCNELMHSLGIYQKSILVIGGAGYVGSALVPLLLEKGYKVRVLDLMIYGETLTLHPNLEIIKGDIRDLRCVQRAMQNIDVVIHLACISNDPSFDLDPELGKSINYDSFEPIVLEAKSNGISRFIFASSSSVYGIKSVDNVDESQKLEPITDYSKYKMLCEEILLKYQDEGFAVCIVRPATVCGVSPRQRLDVIVNILTNHAYHKKQIRINGGNQLRPNVHIKDMVGFYMHLLHQPVEKIAGEIFNLGDENHSVERIAHLVAKRFADSIEILKVDDPDNRSYHISSHKAHRVLNWKNQFKIEDAIDDLIKAFDQNILKDPMSNPLYFNIRRMKEINLK
ncbi:MAG: SDR family oxidoreductase [Bdellovibrio sp.]